MTIAIIIYLVGYVVATSILIRHWIQEFGIEFSGITWAIYGGLLWPVLTVPYIIFLILKRVSDA